MSQKPPSPAALTTGPVPASCWQFYFFCFLFLQQLGPLPWFCRLFLRGAGGRGFFSPPAAPPGGPRRTDPELIPVSFVSVSLVLSLCTCLFCFSPTHKFSSLGGSKKKKRGNKTLAAACMHTTRFRERVRVGCVSLRLLLRWQKNTRRLAPTPACPLVSKKKKKKKQNRHTSPSHLPAR